MRKNKVAVAVELQDSMTSNQVPAPEPGNETAPDAKARRQRRPHVQDLPNMVGDGVALKQFKELDKLGETFIDLRDDKAKLAEELTGVEKNILDAMIKHGLTRYTFSDQEMLIKPGATHVKIKTVKVGTEAEANEEW